MEYAQLNEAGTEATQITTQDNVEWDEYNYCTVEALVKDNKGDQFRIVLLTTTPEPTFDTMTHRCFRDGCEKVNDNWQYKWTVEALSSEQITFNQITASQELYANIIQETQTRLDQFAQTRGYDNILSASTYATSHIPKFAQEGQYCVQQRDATWARLLELYSEIESGTRVAPQSYQDIVVELPTLVWPT